MIPMAWPSLAKVRLVRTINLCSLFHVPVAYAESDLSGRRFAAWAWAVALLSCGGVTRNGDSSKSDGMREPTGGAAGAITEPSSPPSVTEPDPPSCSFIENPAIDAEVRRQLVVPAAHALTKAELATITSLELTGLATLEGVQCLSGLQVLKATNGTLSDLSPVGELSLHELDVNHNAITDLDPLGGYRLPTLQRLEVANNQVASLSALANKPALEIVNAAYNGVSSLSRLQVSHLKQLDLSHNDLRNLGASIGLPEVEQLDVSSNGLSNLAGILYFGALKSLRASDNPLASLGEASMLPNLRQLDVSKTQISDISALRGDPVFDSLNISDTLVADLSPIADWTKDDGVCKLIYLDGLTLDAPSVALAKEGFCSQSWELHPFCPYKCELK
jgi:Leucine-rich repeat (LRR) protein